MFKFTNNLIGEEHSELVSSRLKVSIMLLEQFTIDSKSEQLNRLQARTLEPHRMVVVSYVGPKNALFRHIKFERKPEVRLMNWKSKNCFIRSPKYSIKNPVGVTFSSLSLCICISRKF